MSPSLLATAPGFSPCSVMIGPAKTACEDAGKIVSGAGSVAGFVSDPLGVVANACAGAATWVIDKLAVVVNATTQVDFGNSGFLRVYAVIFGASTFLTLVLWILAVAKRAVRGVPIGTAVGEAVGFLWLALAASAFTPLALALIVGLTDQLTTAIASTTGGNTTSFLTGVGKVLSPTMGGGPVVVILVSLLALVAAAIIWVELLIRAAMLYVGAVMGAAVYSGLVDRDLWRHVRRWIGVMVAVDLAKPVLVVVLALAAAISTTGSPSDAFSSVLSGLAIMFLSIFTSVAVYKFVPAFGDDMASLHHQRKSAANAGPAAAVDGPVAHMRRGMAAHGQRGATSGAGAGTGAAAGAGVATAGATVAAGVAAHAGGAAVRRGVSRMSPPEPAYAGGMPANKGKHARREGGTS
jgi:hypothetical protein